MTIKIVWIIIGLVWGFLGVTDVISDKEIPIHRTVIAEFLTALFAFYLAFANQENKYGIRKWYYNKEQK